MTTRTVSTALLAAACAWACERATVPPPETVTAVAIANPARELVQGRTYCFRATVTAAPRAEPGVRWRARRGSMHPDGCYVADSVGPDTIVVRADADTSRSASRPVLVVGSSLLPLGTMVDLMLPTYDGSGQAIHPSEIVSCPVGPARWRYRTAVTPYPFLDSRYENPSVFVSEDEVHWRVQPGAPNPLVLPGTAAQTAAAGTSPYYTGVVGGAWAVLSDPDFICDPAGNTLRLYFRQVGQSGEYVFVMDNDGDTTWSQPTTVMATHPADGGLLISPTFAHWNGQWQSWSVSGRCGDVTTAIQTRVSPDGRSAFSEPQPVNLTQPGYVVWHIQVRAFRGALWMLYAAYPLMAGTCVSGDLFLARSDNGVDWTTFQKPLISRDGGLGFEAGLYRSSMVYDESTDDLTLQVSGYEHAADKLTAVTRAIRYHLGDLLQGLTPVPPPRAGSVPIALPRLKLPASVRLPFGDGESARFLAEN